MSDPRSMTEKLWQDLVLDTARVHGWGSYHTFDSRRSRPGYPDLTLWHVKRRAYILRELKTDKGRVSKAQQTTLTELRDTGVDVGVWRPADWPVVLAELNGTRPVFLPPTPLIPADEPTNVIARAESPPAARDDVRVHAIECDLDEDCSCPDPPHECDDIECPLKFNTSCDHGIALALTCPDCSQTMLDRAITETAL